MSEMDNQQGFYRVYISCECNKRLYIGFTSKDSNSKYLGSFTDNTFKPTHKIDLHFSEKEDIARLLEFGYQKAWQVNSNPRFANKIVSSLQHHTSSLLAKKLWENPEFKTKTSQAIKKGLSTDEAKNKKSVASKNSWNNKDYREKIITHLYNLSKDEKVNKIRSEKSKEFWNRVENKKLSSKKFKKLWKSEEFREKVLSSIHDYWSIEENKTKQSLKSKELWKKEDFRKKITESTKNLWKDDSYSNKVKEALSDVWKSEEYRLKQRLGFLKLKIKKLQYFLLSDKSLTKNFIKEHKIHSRHDACKVLQRLFREEVRLKTQLETLRQVDNNL